MKLNRIQWAPVFFALFLLQACGGGDGDPSGDGGDTATISYTGVTNQATLTDENADALARAAASGAKQAVISDQSAGLAQRQSAPDRASLLEALARRTADKLLTRNQGLAARPAAARVEDLSSGVCDSGSATLNYSDASDSSNASWSILFTDCTLTIHDGVETNTYRYNGLMRGSYARSDGGGFRWEFHFENFTVSVSGPEVSYTETINLSMTCTSTSAGASGLRCDYYADYSGYDNRTYRVTEVSVSGGASSGFNVSARVYDPNYGYTTISTVVPVTFNCAGGRPGAGRIAFEAAGGASGSIEFISCSQYVVTFNGVSNTYGWE
ncbi:MAG: hypothetical protein KZQ99_15335 [Candidatus Thiodiazotropha sp. (ex Dulcina madagascariensis)]|nr:hypothetical protein [Candidatus Thiodiazotropha sp. (ex Dulcina madagascariensis)]